jgi:hypothetical protein
MCCVDVMLCVVVVCCCVEGERRCASGFIYTVVTIGVCEGEILKGSIQ